MESLGSAQGAVDSLLGTLASVIRDEARLLGNVRSDVQFIKDEMESMNGFLLHVNESSQDDDHQVRAWMKQVRDVAIESERWVDRYLRWAGKAPRGGGLSGYVRRMPHSVLTMSERHEIAIKIQELKARAQEVGERRQRYGVEVPAKKDRHLPAQLDAQQTGRVTGDETDEQYARRCCLEFQDPRGRDHDLSEGEKTNLIGWLTANPEGSDILRLRHIRVDGVGESGKQSLRKVVFDNESVATRFHSKSWITVRKWGGWPEVEAILEQLLLDFGKQDQIQHGAQNPEEKASLDIEDQLQHDAQTPEDKSSLDLENQLQHEISVDLKDQVQRNAQTPEERPSIAQNQKEKASLQLEDQVHHDTQNQKEKSSLELEDLVQHDPQTPKEKASLVLEDQVQHGTHTPEEKASLHQEDQIGNHVQSREEKVTRYLEAKRFLIILDGISDISIVVSVERVLASCGFPTGNAMIVISQNMPLPYRVFGLIHKAFSFYEERATDLVEEPNKGERIGLFNRCIVKLHYDFFCCKMLFRLLYIKPERTLEEFQHLFDSLPNLGGGYPPAGSGYNGQYLRPGGEYYGQYSRPGDGCNYTDQMVLLCSNELPPDYRRCLMYLSIYPKGWRIRRTCLVRRWVAEGLIVRRARLSALDAAERCFTALLDLGLLIRLHITDTGKPLLVEVPDEVHQFIEQTAGVNNFANRNLPSRLSPYFSIENGIQLIYKEWRRRDICCCIFFLPCFICKCIMCGVGRRRRPLELCSIADMLASLPKYERQGLLKVLDLEFCKGMQGRFIMKNICQISELRYLNLRGTNITELPEDVDKLQNLETLDIRQTKVKVLPPGTVHMPKLKHVLSGNIDAEARASKNKVLPGSIDAETRASKNKVLSRNIVVERNDAPNDTTSKELFSAVAMPHEIGNLTEMQILSHVEVSSDRAKFNEFSKLIGNFERLQKLRKLGLVIRGQTKLHLIPVLRSIEKLDGCLRSLSIRFSAPDDDNDAQDDGITLPRFLESLRISGFPDGLPSWALKPHQLVKVTLQDTLLNKSDLQRLRELGSLRSLRIRFSKLSEGQNQLIFQNDGFHSLRFLILEDTNITSLVFEEGAAPRLECIVWSFSTVNNLSGIDHLKRLKKFGLSESTVSDGVNQAIAAHPNQIDHVYDGRSEAIGQGPSSPY